ncbi:hypothetical protein ABKA04_000604 [Annulohypoxylon sp. FPYF3050]
MCQFVLIHFRCDHTELATGPVCQAGFAELSRNGIDTVAWGMMEDRVRAQVELPEACAAAGHNTTRVFSKKWCGWECENKYYTELASSAAQGRFIEQLAALNMAVPGHEVGPALRDTFNPPTAPRSLREAMQTNRDQKADFVAQTQAHAKSHAQAHPFRNSNRSARRQNQAFRHMQNQAGRGMGFQGQAGRGAPPHMQNQGHMRHHSRFHSQSYSQGRIPHMPQGPHAAQPQPQPEPPKNQGYGMTGSNNYYRPALSPKVRATAPAAAAAAQAPAPALVSAPVPAPTPTPAPGPTVSDTMDQKKGNEGRSTASIQSDSFATAKTHASSQPASVADVDRSDWTGPGNGLLEAVRKNNEARERERTLIIQQAIERDRAVRRERSLERKRRELQNELSSDSTNGGGVSLFGKNRGGGVSLAGNSPGIPSYSDPRTGPSLGTSGVRYVPEEQRQSRPFHYTNVPSLNPTAQTYQSRTNVEQGGSAAAAGTGNRGAHEDIRNIMGMGSRQEQASRNVDEEDEEYDSDSSDDEDEDEEDERVNYTMYAEDVADDDVFN